MVTEKLTINSETDHAIQHLLNSPRLPLLVREFQAILAAELERRERFFAELSEQQKAEFINGDVIVQTPAKHRHIEVSDNLFTLLHAYVHENHLGHIGHEKTLVTLTRNDYEPDICFFKAEKARGFTPNQMKYPAPDFVVEVISPSTEAVDRGIKFDDYALHSVMEYWIVHPDEEFVEQYFLRNHYELIVKARTGVVQSVVIEGFEIPVRAIFDAEEHLAALKAILA